MNTVDIFKNAQPSNLARIISAITFIGNPLLYIITIFVGLIRTERVKLFIKQLETCTQRIDELNIPKNYSSLIRYQCIAGIFVIFLISSLIIDDMYWYSDVNLSFGNSLMLQFYYFDNYSYIVMMVINFTFVFWIRYVKIKFGQLNAALLNMLTTTADSPQHKRVLRMKDNWEDESSLTTICGTYKTNENFVKLKEVKQIHLELIKCGRTISEAYGLHILISTAISVLYITLILHSLYGRLISNGYESWIREFLKSFCWIFYFIIQIFVISNICETSMTEVMATGDILCELYEPSTSKTFRDEIRNFTFQLIQNRLTFTACGFYDLGHSFLYSAIGSITTYLVILIQMGDKPKVFSNDTDYNSTSIK
ncbi:gustatory receptor for sugar taste 43a-like [Vespa mandarinia]|uniref:gustatory receptor for sugar taste 43a-like n=1 Tax=Vespa mandarinia TaxID=7446 RepID=UPI0016213F6E|nr:gustatory receptor for sugar taste 43a-like [Vespa mandarinia]